jgi:hypothetical protein
MVYMNARVSSITILETVILASGQMVSCKGSVDELLCLRDIEKEIAGQSSAMAISAVELILLQFLVN